MLALFDVAFMVVAGRDADLLLDFRELHAVITALAPEPARPLLSVIVADLCIYILALPAFWGAPSSKRL